MRVVLRGSLIPLITSLSKKVKDVNTGDLMQDIAKVVLTEVQTRAQEEGLGVNLRKLPKYSPGYARYKRAAGRNIDIRDMTFSGLMWQSLTTRRQGANAAIYFGTAENNKKAYHNDKRAKFFGIGRRESALIALELKKYTQRF